MTEPIYRELEHDIERGWDVFTSHLPGRDYHHRDASATPAPEAPMSVLDTIKADYDEAITKVDDAVAKIKEFGETKIPAALADVQKLEGNPVVDALLSAAHVPTEALSMVVNVIQGLEDLYKPETDTPAPAAPADPAMGEQPQPVPAS